VGCNAEFSAVESSVRDIFVIGGGINGCGIARDAAGRGYSVTLAEMNDFASGTSSGATKLIHGGLRYLEHYKFRLVREALMEREVLWAMAPHIIWPLRFVLPFHKGGIRPAWLIRTGLFLYDHLGGRKLLPATKTLDMRKDPMGKPLKPLFNKAFEYSDGWVDDARLVVLNAKDAQNRGAEILSRTKVIALRQHADHWDIEVENQLTGQKRVIQSRMVVNAAGPWVDKVLNDGLRNTNQHHVRLVQGSHIIIRKKFEDKRAYFFQNPDNRIFFAIPYETDFTLMAPPTAIILVILLMLKSRQKRRITFSQRPMNISLSRLRKTISSGPIRRFARCLMMERQKPKKQRVIMYCVLTMRMPQSRCSMFSVAS
jgi:glycerol-3-phosphate dehydrogenase